MEILTPIIGLLLAGVALALVLYPLWQQTRSEAIFRPNHTGQTLEEYQARYQATLAAIKDLMFDHEMGKVSTEDYQTLLHRTKLEAARIRQQIDRLSHRAGAGIDPALDVQIESLVAQLRKNNLNGKEALLPDIDAEIELLKNIGLDPQARGLTCPHCGKPFEIGDAFCSGCGHSLAGVVPEAGENVCPQCGYVYQSDDAFCARCGAALSETAGAPSHTDAQLTEFSS